MLSLFCKAYTPMDALIKRLPCVKGAVALATEGLFLLNFFILQSLRLFAFGKNPPPFTQGRADYNNKCNTPKKYRQYSHQGVKCSHHNKQLHGGKNIVLHTFYTI